MEISITPDTPAAAPPPGEVSNFTDPPSQQGAIIALEGVFLSLMLLTVIIRIWVRLGPGPRRSWRVDDTTCLLAAIGSVVHMIVYTQSFPLGFGRHLWDIRAMTLIDPSTTRTLSANSVVYPLTICLAKVSILLLYIRLFWVERGIVIAAWLGIVFDVVFYTAFTGLGIGSLVKCADLSDIGTSYCKFSSDGMVMFTSIINVVTDFYLLLLPAYPVLQLKLDVRKWIGVACVFGSGMAACATSLARLINFAIHQHSSDPLWVQGVNAKYTVVEMNIGIIVACVSCFPPFFAQMRSLGSSIYRSLMTPTGTRHSETGTGSNTWESGYPLEEQPSVKNPASIEGHSIESGNNPRNTGSIVGASHTAVNDS